MPGPAPASVVAPAPSPSVPSPYWWRWNDTSTWQTQGHETTPFKSLLVKDGPEINDVVAFEKFKFLTRATGLPVNSVNKIYAIQPPHLVVPFESSRSVYEGRHRESPNLFKKQDWVGEPNADLRDLYLREYESRAAKFYWNEAGAQVTLPLLHGTSEAAVWKICQQAFGQVSTLDGGYFGRGIYFSGNFEYASRYSQSIGPKLFILAAVLPGNPFPVTENPFEPKSYHGQACRPGYQSHISFVNTSDAMPTISTDLTNPAEVVDEIVIFDYGQALPCFVFYMQQ